MRWLSWVLSLLLVLAFAPNATAKVKATPAQKCAAAKLMAMSKKLSGLLACHAKAAGRGAPVDATCVSKAAGKFGVAFAKIDAKGGCIVTGDAPAVEAMIDADVEALANAAPIVPTTTSTSTSTSSSTSTSTSSTTLPTCGTEGASCGSCGSGVCVRHCPGTVLGCVANSSAVLQSCNSDDVCTGGHFCVANGPTCGTGVVNACAAPCP